MKPKKPRDLFKKDPAGFYILPVSGEEFNKIQNVEGIVVEKLGSKFVVKTRSRSVFNKLLERLARRLESD